MWSKGENPLSFAGRTSRGSSARSIGYRQTKGSPHPGVRRHPSVLEASVVGCDNFVPHGSPVVGARVGDSVDGEAVTGGERP